MKNRSILYGILMVLFGVLAYFFIMLGIDTKTKVYVTYQEKSDVKYKVYLHSNDVYEKDYLDMGSRYVSKMTDFIEFNFDYESLYDRSINGYYSYNVSALLIAYTDSYRDSLWEKEYKILEDKVSVIDKNNVNLLKISDMILLDYEKYRNEVLKFIDEYEIDVSGCLLLKININSMLDFKGLDKSVSDDKTISVMIPLTSDLYKVSILDQYDDIDSYYDFSKKEDVNYLFLVIGLFCLAIFIASLIMVIREFIRISKKESLYKRKLKSILTEYDDAIVKVNRFYNKKKYNLIYVDSFSELIDVYNKVNMPINYKEMKKNSEAMFVIIHDDSAWIYKMIAKKMK